MTEDYRQPDATPSVPNKTTASGMAAPVHPEPLDRSEIVSILEENLTVTDEWGGCKLASWQWGGNVCVDGIDAAADAIVARLSKSRQTVSQDVPE